MKFKPFPTCHSHPQSLDTGCLPSSFVKREQELGTNVLTCTDHGSLAAIRTLDKLAKKNSLVFVPGLEGYLRDPDCDILRSFGITDSKAYSKYYHLTIHFLDQEAYETGVRLLSKADDRAEKHGSERKPLFDWAAVEEMGSKNVTMTSSCLGGITAVHLKEHNHPDIAEAYFKRVMGFCKPGNFYVEVAPHKCRSKIDTSVVFTFEDGTEERVRLKKKIMLSNGEEYAEELSKQYARKKNIANDLKLLAVMDNRKWVERPPQDQKVIVSIKTEEREIFNECTDFAPDGDVQKGANSFVLSLAEKYKLPIIIGDDSHFAYPEQKTIQDIRLSTQGGWKFPNSNHRLSSEEAYETFRSTLGITPTEFDKWVETSVEWAGRFKDFSFKDRRSLPTKFYPTNTLKYTIDLIEKHGRMKWDNPVYKVRLKAEIDLLHKNGTIDLLPYFFPIEEALTWYRDNLKKVTSPGRGSSGGLLLSYCLGITNLDPIRYDLSQDRFLTLDRIQQGKLPDIDSDFANRDPLINPQTGWFKKRFGDHFIQVSTDTSLKLRSAALDVARTLEGKVPEKISKLTAQFSNAPQGVSDKEHVFGYKGSDGEWVKGTLEEGHGGTDYKLIEYIKEFPKHWEIVKELIGICRGKGRHPCSHLITNEPVQNFIPITSVSDIKVTQYTAESCEMAGAIKYDFLGLNSLDDIDQAVKLIQNRQGFKEEKIMINGQPVNGPEVLPFKGQNYWLWDLPEDQAVYNDICEGNTATVFQLDTPGAVKWLKYFNFTKPNGNKGLDSIESLAVFAALDRKGPLDYYVKDKQGKPVHNMLVEYAERVRGGEGNGRLEILDKLLPETYGVIAYQEQLTKVFKEIGSTTGIQAENFRIHTSKKQVMEVIKDKEIFMPGAIAKLGVEAAEELWDSLETFAQYGFCIDGEQEIITKNGLIKMKDVDTNSMEVAYLSKDSKILFEKPSAHICSGEKEVFEVELEDGTTILATEDHKFLYEGQWVTLKDAILFNNQMEVIDEQDCKRAVSVFLREEGDGQHSKDAFKIKKM